MKSRKPNTNRIGIGPFARTTVTPLELLSLEVRGLVDRYGTVTWVLNRT